VVALMDGTQYVALQGARRVTGAAPEPRNRKAVLAGKPLAAATRSDRACARPRLTLQPMMSSDEHPAAPAVWAGMLPASAGVGLDAAAGSSAGALANNGIHGMHMARAHPLETAAAREGGAFGGESESRSLNVPVGCSKRVLSPVWREHTLRLSRLITLRTGCGVQAPTTLAT